MSTPCSTHSARRPCSLPGRSRAAALAIAALLPVIAVPQTAPAQQIVFDPTNHIQSVLQSARLLQQLTNQTAQLANEARMLSASPLRQAGEISGAIGAIQQLSQNVEGIASDVAGVERQFGSLYASGASGQQRLTTALNTAQDLARLAAQVQTLGQGRTARVQTTLTASEAAQGPTAAAQSTAQLLGILAEELASLRTLLAAQSRLLAEATARQAADRTARIEARRQLWAHPVAAQVPPPGFDPLPNAGR